MVATFLKNGHCYKRDYHVRADSLGGEISAWWDSISGTAHVGFGGPTGIYTMVVLMTWWCSLLRDRSDSDRADCVVLVDKLNLAILEAILRADQSGSGPPSTNSILPASPPPPSQHSRHLAKRAHNGGPSSSRKKPKF